VDDFYAARDNTMPSLPWPSIAPPFTLEASERAAPNLGRNKMEHGKGDVCCARCTQRARRQPSRNIAQALQAVRLRASDLMGQQVNGKGRNAVMN